MSQPPEFDRDDREDAPFLSSNSNSRSGPSEGKPSDKQQDAATARKIGFRLKLILFMMILAVDIGFAFLEGPMVRILESIACRQYFISVDPSQIDANGNVPESQCKLAEIQAELAAVKGYHMFFDGILSMFKIVAVLLLCYNTLTNAYQVPQWPFLMVCWQIVVVANQRSPWVFLDSRSILLSRWL